jgi:alkylation response protein AidB-like acyl-CoA dehydrogenase
MDLSWNQHEIAFREQVRDFTAKNLPADIRDKQMHHRRLARDDYVRWHRILAAHGWGAPNWPKEYGGTGWTGVERLLFEVETFKAGAPRLLSFGLTMIGPVLIKFGNEQQKAHFLPRIINLDDWWCQGYSEPGSGSDLASLKTRAVRQGDKYIINGQKTWTTLGHHANWIFCLCRTDPNAKAQRGISLILIDMRQPGVTVRPIKTLDGGTEVNEVWLENVEAPIEQLVGQENEGWTYAKYLLGHERTGIAGIGHCHRELAILKQMASQAMASGESLSLESRVMDQINQVEIQVLALEMLLLRVAADNTAGPGPQASILKIRGSELQQELARLQMQIAGPDAWPYDPQWMEQDNAFHGPGGEFDLGAAATYFDLRKTTIYGGTNEIQKAIIVKQIIGV